MKAEKVNIESDIEFIKFIGTQGVLSEKRKEKIVKNIEKTNKTIERIENIINKEKNEIDRQILFYRFIRGLTIKEISDIMCYSTSSISRKLLKYEEQDEQNTKQ